MQAHTACPSLRDASSVAVAFAVGEPQGSVAPWLRHAYFGNKMGTELGKYAAKSWGYTQEEAIRINKIDCFVLPPEEKVAGSNPARRTI